VSPRGQRALRVADQDDVVGVAVGVPAVGDAGLRVAILTRYRATGEARPTAIPTAIPTARPTVRTPTGSARVFIPLLAKATPRERPAHHSKSRGPMEIGGGVKTSQLSGPMTARPTGPHTEIAERRPAGWRLLAHPIGGL
jgi:hypothetical protein